MVSWKSGILVSVVLGGIATGADQYRNPRLALNYPDHSFYFQDHRSVWEVFADLPSDGPIAGGNPLDPARAVACYDPKSPPSKEIMDQLERAMQAAYGSRFQSGGSRWGATNPVTITWSFVPDGVSLPGGNVGNETSGPSELFARLDSQFGAANRALWISRFQQVFDRWQALTGINYVRVTNGTNDWDDGAVWGSAGGATRGDIRISMKRIDAAGGVLAYNQYPSGGGDMTLDRWESWQNSSGNHRLLRNVVAHEHGHGIGLAHVCPLGNSNGTWKLMEPYINNAYDGPQQDDIRGAQAVYGDPYELNNTAATASVLGPLTPGTPFVLGPIPAPAPGSASLLSVSTGFDTDYYQFTVDQPRLVNVTVTPVGNSYSDDSQSGDCQSGTWASTNSLTEANLAFDVRSSAGTVVFRAVNDTAAGSAETTSGLLIGPGGDFFVRVYASGTTFGPQAYNLSVTAATTALACAASDATFSDKVRISWPGAIADATGYQVLRGTTNSTQFATTIATLAGGVLQYDDTTAVPGTQYYYWTKAQQPGATGYRYMQTSGEQGSRGIANVPPTANAGQDQTLTDTNNSGGEPLTLNGSLSTDSDGTIVNYLWQEGAVTLANSASPTSNISLPVGAHTITLTVTDNSSATAADTVLITVNSPTNQPPTANAGQDQTLTDTNNNGSEPVTLNGSLSTDSDGTIVNYLWQEGAVTIATSALPTSNVALPVGAHTITLTVTDDDTATATDTVLITVNPPPNQPPVASAGADQTVSDADISGSESVTLNASLSSDSDGTIVNYLWQEGDVPLASSASPTSNVVLPLGVHTITLTVTDDDSATATDTVVITVDQPANQPPVANAGPDQALTDSDRGGDESVTLSGSLSSDPDGTIVNYLWQEGAETLANGPGASPTVVLSAGSHDITLTVTDNRGGTASDSVTVTIDSPCAADYNQDGGVDGADVDAFFSDWSSGNPAADVNADGGVDGADVETFFQVWEAGGC